MLLCMTRKTKEPTRPPGHFLREWRNSRGWTLEQLAEKVAIEADALEQQEPFYKERSRSGSSHGTISRVERGEVPYTQHLLDVLARVYGTDPGSLIMRNPLLEDAPWSIVDQVKPLTPGQQRVVAAFIDDLIERSKAS